MSSATLSLGLEDRPATGDVVDLMERRQAAPAKGRSCNKGCAPAEMLMPLKVRRTWKRRKAAAEPPRKSC